MPIGKDHSYYRDVSAESRKTLAEKGHAMPDGSFPIANRSDLMNAIQAIGRASDPDAVKAYIKKRAGELDCADCVPGSWTASSNHSAEYAELKGVEIFATGKHNGDDFSESDLDSMAAAHKVLDFKPPIKQGHRKDTPGEPALGYVENVRRVGTKLLADFVDMPDIVMDALRRKSYNRVSSEVYFDLTRGGEKYKRALKAVALLGAEIPAVAGLAPLSSLFGEIDSEVRVYEFGPHQQEDIQMDQKDLDAKLKTYDDKFTKLSQETSDTIKTYKEKADAAELQAKKDREELDGLKKKDRETTITTRVAKCSLPALRPHFAALYEVALDIPVTREFALDAKGEKKATAVQVLDGMIDHINTKVAKIFKDEFQSSNHRAGGDGTDGLEFDNPSEEVDRLTKEYCVKNNVDYGAGMKIVLAQNPELKEAYAAVQMPH